MGTYIPIMGTYDGGLWGMGQVLVPMMPAEGPFMPSGASILSTSPTHAARRLMSLEEQSPSEVKPSGAWPESPPKAKETRRLDAGARQAVGPVRRHPQSVQVGQRSEAQLNSALPPGPVQSAPAPGASSSAPRSGRPPRPKGAPTARGQQLPEALMVRNTFLGTRPERSPSLERFFEERKIKSSPPSGPPSCPPSGKLDYAMAPHLEDLPWLTMPTPGGGSQPGSALMTPDERFAWFQTPSMSQTIAAIHHAFTEKSGRGVKDSPMLGPADNHSLTGSSTADSTAMRIITPLLGTSSPWLDSQSHSVNSNSGSADLPELLARENEEDPPELGSALLPSRGSLLHNFQACKPCAFFHEDGCANGMECPFCHLCQAGEKKRRKKERVNQRREAYDDRRGKGRGKGYGKVARRK